MNLFKYMCCRETLKASIQIGEIKNKSTSGSPSLEVHISLTLGGIKSTTDFLYLQPQVDPKSSALDPTRFHTNGTALSKGNAQINNGGGPDDKEPLPKRLKDVNKERVVLIEKSSALCENVGVAYVDLSIERGKYKLYYMRIENEQRIMSNSRLEILGSSSAFSINKLTTDLSNSKSVEGRKENFYYEESYSNYSQEQSCEMYKRKREHQFDDSSSLDSVMLLKQIQLNNQNTNSYSQSVMVQSSDQTRIMHQSISEDLLSYNGGVAQSNDHPSHTISSSNYNSEMSQCSQSSSATYVVRKDNDEAMIMTSQQSGSQKNSKHKRGHPHIQTVLEDISNTSKGSQQIRIEARHQYSKKQTGGGSKGIRKGMMGGKENRIYIGGQQHKKTSNGSGNEYYEFKSHSFTNGDHNRGGHQRVKHYAHGNDDDDELEVKFVTDIDSLVPPKFNPDTRTYFKLSIYSPSNRLYTVNEEVNSTQSEMGYTEQFSQMMNNGAVKSLSGDRKSIKAQQLHFKAQAEEMKIEEEQQQVDNWDNEECDLSESMVIPNSPSPKVAQFIQMQTNIGCQYQKQQNKEYSESMSSAHTRANSSKAQSLKGSIIISKPQSTSPLLSNATTQGTNQTCANQKHNSQSNEDQQTKRELNMFLRESFNEFKMKNDFLKSLDGADHNRGVQNMSEDINIYVNKMKESPGSFVCTGGTEFYKGESNKDISKFELEQQKPSTQKNKKNLQLKQNVVKQPSKQQQEDDSPQAFFDEENRKVVIIQTDPDDGNEVEHCIHWDEETDPKEIGMAIEQVLEAVKTKSQKKVVKNIKGKKVISNY